jgi:hypothetical protein
VHPRCGRRYQAMYHGCYDASGSPGRMCGGRDPAACSRAGLRLECVDTSTKAYGAPAAGHPGATCRCRRRHESDRLPEVTVRRLFSSGVDTPDTTHKQMVEHSRALACSAVTHVGLAADVAQPLRWLCRASASHHCSPCWAVVATQSRSHSSRHAALATAPRHTASTQAAPLDSSGPYAD